MAGQRTSLTEFTAWAQNTASQEHATGQLNPLLTSLAAQAQRSPPAQEDQDFMVHNAKHEQEKGNMMLKQNNLRAALDSYSTGLHILGQVPDQSAFIAKLLCNRSLVYMKLSMLDEAGQDAMRAMLVDSCWHKGYWRHAKVCIALGQMERAVHIYLICCKNCHKTMEPDDLVETIKEITICSVKVSSEYLYSHSFEGVNYPPLVWTQVLHRLAKSNCWYHMALLLLGQANNPPIICTCSAASIELENLLGVGTIRLQSWGLLLLIRLMKMGAMPESMSADRTTPVLHVAMETCLRLENLSLVEHLLTQHFSTAEKSGQERDPGTGNSILHLAAMHRSSPALRKQAVRLVLAHGGVDPLTKNRASKTAAECCSGDDAACKRLIEDAMTQKRQSDPVYQLDACKDEARKQRDRQNLLGAIAKFTEAMTYVGSKTDARTKAELYHGRGEAFKKLGNLTQALEDARECARVDRKWIKSQMLLAELFSRKKHYSMAIAAYVAAFSCTEKTDVRIYILSQLLDIGSINVNTSLFDDVQNGMKSLGPSASLRRSTVLYLMNKKNLHVRLFIAAIMGFMDRCDLSGINYACLLEADLDRVELQITLANLLNNGADLCHLKIDRTDTAFHVAAFLFIRTFLHTQDELRSSILINVVLKLRPDLLNAQDGDGSTALHMVAKEQDDKCRAVCLGILLHAMKADPTIKDHFGNRASEYLRDTPVSYQAMKAFEVQYETAKSRLSSGDASKKGAVSKKLGKAKQQGKGDATKQSVKQSDAKQGAERAGGEKGTPAKKASIASVSPCSMCESRIDAAKMLSGKAYWSKAVDKVMEVVRTLHKTSRHQKILGDAYKLLRKAILIKDIFSKASVMHELVLQLPEKEVKLLVNEAARDSKWHVVAILLTAFLIKVVGGESCLRYPRDCLAKREKEHQLQPAARAVDLASQVAITAFISCNYEKNFLKNRSQLLQYLLRMGASPDERAGSEQLCPLAACVQQKDYSSVCVLLRHGADPIGLATEQDQLPLQVALPMALAGHHEPMETLFTVYTVYQDSVLEPNIPDKDGNTLFHMAAAAKSTTNALKLVELLCRHGYNPNLRNNADHNAKDCLKNLRSDRRLQYIRQTAARFEKVPPAKNKAQKAFQPPEESATETQSESAAVRESRKSQKSSDHLKLKSKSKDENLQAIKLAIEEMPDYEPKTLDDSTLSTGEPSSAAAGSDGRQDADAAPKQPVTEAEQAVLNADDADDAAAKDDDDDDEEMPVSTDDPTIFDDLDWEVECTSDVWRTLQNKRVLSDMKRRIIGTIQLLASGEWSNRLCKKLKGAPDTMQLFEAKLSRDSRLIWELAIAFSPRRSETAERRLGVESGEASGAKGGRIYSEIIRVWEIVLAHDHISRSVDRISKSHKRGRDCIVYKKLKGIERRQFADQNFVEKKLPMLFMEDEDIALPADVAPDTNEDFFPPASSKETEYHIMKFYSFSSALVNNIFQEQGMKVDFPFKVTDLEHAIINLRPKPPCSLLLLGRSGTGKTTCCLYRLWSSFINYWEVACDAPDPLLPRTITFLQDHDDDEDEDEDTESAADKAQAQLTLDDITAKKIKEEQPQQGDEVYDHLHQIFITKNAVLCSEVQKTFRELSHAHTSAATHVAVEELPLPYRLQEAHPAAFPLFITSRQFLMLLDGSLPGRPFFPKNEDGSLARQVKGWNDDDGPLTFLPDMEEEDEEELEEDVMFDQPEIGVGAREKTRTDPRKHVSYEVFVNELWNHINKEKLDYHPSLVWMEITSFILGSVEANGSPNGYLSEDEYMTLGKKRAPNFSGDRNMIYGVFKRYQRTKAQKGLFDESDLIHNLYKRMEERDQLDWVIHEIYVDETQDFTQAELSLLIKCSQNPNNLFFTGDTAQSIMRGIAFRFEDLKTLFYYARQSLSAVGKASAVQVPKRVYQLTHNYRSHAGILRLANSVVELMLKFFPESFDRLKPDQGLFEGPRPVLLESYSFSDLAVLLSGSRRKTSSPIEFGAHQAILVANDEAREQLPPELSTALVLTIFESKGLEFDDVLLYNFFCDSPAQKEWRIVTKHLDELEKNNEQAAAAAEDTGVGLRTIDISQMDACDRPRPLDFDPEKHKVLNSELKFLYTAITRARVNVWIFDENHEARSPMFEYFRALRLVQSIIPGEDMEEIDDDNVSKMFTSKSTSEEWDARGDEFYRRNLFNVAAKCFLKSGNCLKQKMSQAQQQALDAGKMKSSPKEMREQFVAAAAEFLQCNMGVQAARCLFNAKEIMLAAQVFERLGQFHHAAKLYGKMRRPEEASRCHEQVQQFRQAVEVLLAADQFDKAIDVVGRHQMLSKNAELSSEMTRRLESNAPSTYLHSVRRLSVSSAEYYHNHGQEKSMQAALSRIPEENERIKFLLKHKYTELAQPLLREQGRGLEIAQQYREAGKIEKALEYASETENAQFCGECHLTLARNTLLNHNREEGAINDLTRHLQCALDLLQERSDRLEAQVMMASVHKDAKALKKMQGLCKTDTYLIGEIACFELRLKQESDRALTNNVSQDFIPALEAIFKLLAAFAKQTSNVEKKYVLDCFKYYGLAETSSSNLLLEVKKKEGARIVKVCVSSLINDGKISKDDAVKKLSEHYIKKAHEWVHKVRQHLKEKEVQTSICPHFLAGFTCSENNDCAKQMHKVPYHKVYMEHLTVLMDLIALGQAIRQATQRSKDLDHQLKDLSDQDLGKWCRNLREHIFPDRGIPWWSISDRRSVDELLQARDNKYVLQAMKDHMILRLERKDSLQRQACGNLHLEVMHIINMMNFDQKLLSDFLNKQAIAFNKGSAEKKKKALGFVPDKKGSLYFSYFHFYLAWIQALHKKISAYEAFTNLNHFLNYLSSNQVLPLLPSIAHAMDLMEISFVILQAMYTCLFTNVHVILPLSYVYLLNMWNRSHATQKGYSDLHIVIEKEQKFEHLLRFLNEFVGHMTKKVELKFDLVQDALCGVEEYILSGEAERVLVMALVILVNSGSEQLVDESNKGRLLDALSKVDIADDNVAYKYPKRMKEALEELGPAASPKDITPILAKLLAARSNEELRNCSWDKTRHRFFIHKDVTVMGSSAFVPVQKRAPHQKKFKRKNRTEESTTEPVPARMLNFGDTSEICAQIDQQMESDKKKEQAASIMQRAVRKALFRRRLTKGLREYLKSNMTLHKYNIHLADFVDASMCQLCNVSFDAAPADQESDESVMDGENAEQAAAAVQSRHVNTASAQKRQHLATSQHKTNAQEFQLLKNYVNTSMSQLLVCVDKFAKDCVSSAGQDADQDAGHVRKDEEKELQKVADQKERVLDERKNIERKREWGSLEDLQYEMELLQKSLRECKGFMEESERNKKKHAEDLAKQRELMGDDHDILDADDIDEEDHLMTVTVKKPAKGASKMRRQKKTRRGAKK